ncbi:MAG: 6-phosphogluconolactonase [Verrucomicrobiota bacterium]
MNPFELKTFADAAALADEVAALWLEQIKKRPAQTVALSGGRISRLFFQKVSERALAEEIFLSEIDFFWADERCVPPSDPESNFALANETLFSLLNISPQKIHRLAGELEQAEAVQEANREISRVISPSTNGQPALDLIFLGLGPDGHVASLFPNAAPEVLHCDEPFLSIQNSPKPPAHRLSLSYAAIAAAKEVWVLISGEGKESALRESLSGYGTTPLANVLKSRFQTRIFTDLKL